MPHCACFRQRDVEQHRETRRKRRRTMKPTLVTMGAVALTLMAANLAAQDRNKNLNPVFPGRTQTNTNGVGAPGLNRGLIIGGATNSAATNGIGQGAPGRGTFWIRARVRAQRRRTDRRKHRAWHATFGRYSTRRGRMRHALAMRQPWALAHPLVTRRKFGNNFFVAVEAPEYFRRISFRKEHGRTAQYCAVI